MIFCSSCAGTWGLSSTRRNQIWSLPVGPSTWACCSTPPGKGSSRLTLRWVIFGICDQFPSGLVSSGKEVAAAAGPHGVAGAVCSPGSISDAPISVTSEGFLVTDVGRSLSARSTDSGMKGCVHWWLLEERWSASVPLQIPPPSLLLYIDVSLSGWGTHPFFFFFLQNSLLVVECKAAVNSYQLHFLSNGSFQWVRTGDAKGRFGW